ncbi:MULTISPECIES: hydroxypyruvate isomerase family protein [unclassified Shinella]|uniref:hydroxypyruvate isomerase family protein n=1 Tax=unclassified Shinella TaxID=2643062 RepID=UPI00225CF5A7|nr:TIM barrel protein [Shinella sp. YE25]MDC7259229.1 TIM barrel protein [Shinella sp. YE25]CAI0336012.1 Hydroxypyruvate isomerase [Rhizobiaceae bacterium]CAK7261405.1 hydroxypyruvate isomerase [Shinella sp. WSC3-e]
MNRLSAHIGYLYADLPLAERPAAAAHDGFTAVEHPEPWAVPAKEMRARLADLGLTFSQVTSGMGDAAAGEKGLAALAGREAEFRAGFDRALAYALEVDCPFVHPMAGVPKGGLLDAAETYRLNLSWALNRVEGSGVRVLVEAITIPGYHMGSLTLAADLQDQFQGRFALLFDTYHAAVLGEDPRRWITRNAGRLGHVHIADHPGRHEPGTGTLSFESVLTALTAAGYAGAIGFEYIPSAATSASAAFLPGWKRLLSEKVSP